jgi:hypothetical protein
MGDEEAWYGDTVVTSFDRAGERAWREAGRGVEIGL